MNDRSAEEWDGRLAAIASSLQYPPTPDLAAAVRRRLAGEPRRAARRRRLAWAGAALALLVLGLLAVPQVRATVVEFLRLGAVRIFLGEPTATPAATTRPGASPTVARPTPTPLASLLDLAGETTLAEARREAGFYVPLPAYPPELGEPDHVYLQTVGGKMVVLVWLNTEGSTGPISLHLLGPGTFADKVKPRVLLETTVNGRPALWAEGAHMYELRRGDLDIRRLVPGNVLIWTEGEITYRLETDLPPEEAVRIAESLR